MEFSITPGTTTDLEAVMPLWLAMVEHHRDLVGNRIPVRPGDEAWTIRQQEYASALDDDTGTLLLARSPAADEAVGYAFCRVGPSGSTFDLGQTRGEVESLAVSPEARGQGIGSALLESCRQVLRDRHCTHWAVGVVDGNPASRLYQRAGFEPWIHELVGRLDAETATSSQPDA